jgi:hypothetical protein
MKNRFILKRKGVVRYNFLILFMIFSLLISVGFAQNNRSNSKNLKRAESFFGIHFDFHAGQDCKEIGKNVSEEAITDILELVKPDFIQIDCKGHPGLSSYLTNVGNRAPGFIGDPLKIWRAATNKKNVALYMHYSGVFDQQAIRNDPSLARINNDGNRDTNMTSVFGQYVDKIMIPQFKELNDIYGVDGVWVDGDCWATGIDYGREAAEAFTKATGVQKLPKSSGEQNYFELCDFSRKAFQNYVKHYLDEMHKHNPNFQIASNWSFSSFMPEPVNMDVDFLSGDYNYVASLNSARWEGRCLQNQGKPWDLMSWGFTPKDGSLRYKSEIQLKQEAAAVISLGGGFQAYFTQNRDGSVLPWKVKPMAGVGKFIRERQKYCQYSKPIPQIALFFSKEDFYRRIPKLFGGWEFGDYIKGVLFALLDGQNSVQVLSEHHLKGKLNNYPLIVLPEMYYMEDSLKKELLDYVNNGGSLLVTGMQSAKFFKDDVKMNMAPDSLPGNFYYLEFNDEYSTITSPYKNVTLPTDAINMGYLYSASSPRAPKYNAGAIIPYGNGKIGFIFTDIGLHYFKGSSSALRNYVSAFVKALFPNPIVEVKGSHLIDVTLNELGNKKIINLVNIGGNHNSGIVDVYDEVPPLTNIVVSIRCDKKPSKIILLPENKSVNFDYKNEKANLVIPKVEIHSLLVVE